MARQPFLAVPQQTREFDNKQRETAQAAHFSVQVSSNGGGNQVSRLLLSLQKAMRRNCHILQIGHPFRAQIPLPGILKLNKTKAGLWLDSPCTI